jgi:hypothetical protein
MHHPAPIVTINLGNRYIRVHKPRIYRWATTWPGAMRWHCTDGTTHGLGQTPADAYRRFLTQCFADRSAKDAARQRATE